MTLNAAPPSVRSVGRLPGSGLTIGTAVNRLQPQQLPRTNFTNFRSFGIQYVSRTAAIVRSTPPCRVSTCVRCTSFFVNNVSAGKYVGKLPCNLLQHS